MNHNYLNDGLIDVNIDYMVEQLIVCHNLF